MAKLNFKEVLKEAKELKKEFDKTLMYWSLKACVEAVCDKHNNTVSKGDRLKAVAAAITLDNNKTIEKVVVLSIGFTVKVKENATDDEILAAARKEADTEIRDLGIPSFLASLTFESVEDA